MSPLLEGGDQIPPQNLVQQYHDLIMDKKAMIYFCMVSNKDQKEGIFIERAFNQKVEGTCRMFFRQEDVEAYMETIAIFSKDSVVSVKQCETSPENLVEAISKLSEKNIQEGGKGFQILACVVHENAMKNLDIFWTADKENMV